MAFPASDPTSSEYLESPPEQVKLYLPKILGQVAYHADYMQTAIRLLWELGKSDTADMSRATDHAHYVLVELSKQRYGRHVTFYETYMRCLEVWCSEADAFERDFTPLHIIPCFLVRDGSESYYFPQTQSIHIQPFNVLPEPMRDVRRRAIRLLVSIAEMNEKPKLQYRAIEALRNLVIRGLTYTNTPELRAQWYEEDRVILAELVILAQKAKSPFLSYRIEYGVRLALKHPDNAPIADDLRAMLDALPLDLDTEIIWYIKHGTSATQFSKQQSEEYIKSINTTSREIAERMLKTCPTSQSMKQKLDALILHLASYDQELTYPNFLEVLAEIDPALGHQLCRLVVNDPSSPVVKYFTHLVVPIRKWNLQAFLDLIRDALNSDNPDLRRGAAYAIYKVTDFTDEEAVILLTLIQDADPGIAMGAIYAMHQLPEEVQDTAFSVLENISFTPEDEGVVNAICEALNRRMSKPAWDPIPSITAFLQKCVLVPEISEIKYYSLCSFLARYRWRFPQIVANFCLDRVKYQRSLPEEQHKRYAPTSCLSEHLAPETRPEAEQHVEARYTALCTLRDELLAFEESEIAAIFAYLANGYDATALQVLSEWLESGEEKKVRLIAKLIHAAPPSFVFDNEDFVERLLATATTIDNSVSDVMSGALLSSAMPFGYVVSIVPGQPSSVHVQMRDRAQEIADKYPPGSIMHTFYMTLKREAEYRIEMQRSWRDEENHPQQIIVT